ncbi:hypothetical protein C1M55_28325 [Rhodococcus qingshengii]|uniref:DUF6197 family protein n=1 Tax=Rhodococcus qingshengii TaxID=334542 RepID=UPI000C9EFC78|nr:hypothetical protein [Rhodococcus qingshengii]AUS34638.1 hypothetical protein C1M55_28325 [Rhodococcus qingshengii]
MNFQIKVDLLNAANILETEGWGQEGYIISGDPEDSTYCYCAAGSILRAVGIPPENIDPDDYKGTAKQEDRFDRAMDALGVSLGLDPGYGFVNWNSLIPEWNDADDQTAGNVIASIRKAAGELK